MKKSKIKNQKKFHLSDILSVTTATLVSTNKMRGLYEILNFIKNENLFSHQISDAIRECKKVILKQHPSLSKIESECLNSVNYKDWLDKQISEFGNELTVTSL
jgi:hypothetical protein